MKRLLLVAVAFTAFVTTSFATGEKKASYWVLQQFRSVYADAKDVTWSASEEYAKASFLLDGIKVEAYYSQDGTFIGQTKAVPPQYLPKNALKKLEKSYKDFTMKEVIEFSNASDVDFFVSLESSDKKLVLKISRSGEISIYKQSVK